MRMSRTGDKRIPEDCKLCNYFRVIVRPKGGWIEFCLGARVQPDSGWFEFCEATGELLVWDDGELKKSDNCPFMEVEDE